MKDNIEEEDKEERKRRRDVLRQRGGEGGGKHLGCRRGKAGEDVLIHAQMICVTKVTIYTQFNSQSRLVSGDGPTFL